MKNKKLTIFLIIILSVIAISLSIFFAVILANKHAKFINFGYFNINHKVSDELVFDEEYDNIFKEINIASTSSDIEIKESSESKIKVVIYGDKDETSVNSENNKLTIKSKGKSCIGFCFNISISKIELYLPKNYNNELIITNNYGDIKIDEFINMNLNASLDAGDIVIESVKYAKIINKYGDIKITKYAEELDIKEDCGDINVSEVNFIKVTNNYGDINISKVNDSLDIEEDCGDVELGSINLNKNSYIKNSYGDININKTNKIYIDAKTSLGETKIKNNYRESDITLTITNSCGDIKVNN